MGVRAPDLLIDVVSPVEREPAMACAELVVAGLSDFGEPDVDTARVDGC